jgi:hypothetical protein
LNRIGRFGKAGALMHDAVGGHRHHLCLAVANIAGDMDAGHLEPAVGNAYQNGRTGVAATAVAGVQQELPGVNRLTQLAIAIGGHGVAAILAVAGDYGSSAARCRLAAKPERQDFIRQVVKQGQHHPVGADRLLVLQRVVARSDLVAGNAGVGDIATAAVAGKKMQ